MVDLLDFSEPDPPAAPAPPQHQHQAPAPVAAFDAFGVPPPPPPQQQQQQQAAPTAAPPSQQQQQAPEMEMVRGFLCAVVGGIERRVRVHVCLPDKLTKRPPQTQKTSAGKPKLTPDQLISMFMQPPPQPPQPQSAPVAMQQQGEFRYIDRWVDKLIGPPLVI